MRKTLTILLLALLLGCSALAEVYEGATAAMDTVTVTSEVSGALRTLNAHVGDRVQAGQALMELRGKRTFAAQEGSISLVNAEEGEKVEGSVLELAPLERYLIHCTVEKAYQSSQSTLVHSGETVYVRCTSDGTHRAIGTVTQIDGKEYRVLTVGGELYIGETVYLYRDADFTTAQRVGIGTVVANDTQVYEATGKLTKLYVDEGDTVERGQLLYETNGGSVNASVTGIVTSLSVQPGDAVEEGQAVAEIVPDGSVCVEIRVEESEASRIHVGQSAELALAGEGDERAFSGTVIGSAWMSEDDTYTVRILPEEGVTLPLGMSVTVRL